MGNKPTSVAAEDVVPIDPATQQSTDPNVQVNIGKDTPIPATREFPDNAAQAVNADGKIEPADLSPPDTQSNETTSEESIGGMQGISLLKPAFDKSTSVLAAAGSSIASALPPISGSPMGKREKRDSVGSGPKSLAHNAAYENDIKSLTKIHKENSEALLTLDENGHSVLHYAIINGHMESCSWLLNKAPELISKQDAHRHTPVFQACSVGQSDILGLLIGLGADTHVRDAKGLTAAHICSTSECLRILTENSVDLLDQDLRGRNAMWTSCEHGRVECVQFLLERPEAKSMLATTDMYGETPVHVAAKNGHFEVIQRLRRKLWRALLLQTNDEGETAEQLATKFQHNKCAMLLQTLAPADAGNQNATQYHGADYDNAPQGVDTLGEWVQHFDQASGNTFWFNAQTQETLWHPPEHGNNQEHANSNSAEVLVIDHPDDDEEFNHINDNQDDDRDFLHLGTEASGMPLDHHNPQFWSADDTNNQYRQQQQWEQESMHSGGANIPSRPSTAGPSGGGYYQQQSMHNVNTWGFNGQAETYNGFPTIDQNAQWNQQQFGNNNWHQQPYQQQHMARPMTAQVLTGYNDGGAAAYGATPIGGVASPVQHQQFHQRPDTAQSYNSIFADLDVEADAVNPMRPNTAGSQNYVSDDEDINPSGKFQDEDVSRPGSPWTQRRRRAQVEDWQGEWAQYYDPDSERSFWWNSITGECRWEPPGGTGGGGDAGEGGYTEDGEQMQMSQQFENAGEFENTESHHIRQRSYVVAKYGDWTECKDPVSGDVFFYNNHTGECEWELPPEEEEARLKAQEDEEAEIERAAYQEAEEWVWTMRRKEDVTSNPRPPASKWSMMQDSDSGAVFFINKETGETRWEEPAEVRAAEEFAQAEAQAQREVGGESPVTMTEVVQPTDNNDLTEEEKAAIIEKARDDIVREMREDAKAKQALTEKDIQDATNKIREETMAEMAAHMKKAMEDSRAEQDKMAEKIRKETQAQLNAMSEHAREMQEKLKRQAMDDETRAKKQAEMDEKIKAARELQMKLHSDELERTHREKKRVQENRIAAERKEKEENTKVVDEEKAEILAEHEEELKQLASVLAADRSRQKAKLKEKLEERRKNRALKRAATMSKVKDSLTLGTPKGGRGSLGGFSNGPLSPGGPRSPGGGRGTRLQVSLGNDAESMKKKSFGSPKSGQTPKGMMPNGFPGFGARSSSIQALLQPAKPAELSDPGKAVRDILTSDKTSSVVEALLKRSQSLRSAVDMNRQFLNCSTEFAQNTDFGTMEKSSGIWFLWTFFRYFCLESSHAEGHRVLQRLVIIPSAFRGFVRAIGFARAKNATGAAAKVGLPSTELDKILSSIRQPNAAGLDFTGFLDAFCEVVAAAFEMRKEGELMEQDLDGDIPEDKPKEVAELKCEEKLRRALERHMFEPGRAIARFMFKRSEKYQNESKLLATDAVRKVLKGNVVPLKMVYVHYVKIVNKVNLERSRRKLVESNGSLEDGVKKDVGGTDVPGYIEKKSIRMHEVFQFAVNFSIAPDLCTVKDLYLIFEDMHIHKPTPPGGLAGLDVPFNKWVQLLFHAAMRFYKVSVADSDEKGKEDSKTGIEAKTENKPIMPDAHLAVVAFLSWLDRSGGKRNVKGMQGFSLNGSAATASTPKAGTTTKTTIIEKTTPATVKIPEVLPPPVDTSASDVGTTGSKRKVSSPSERLAQMAIVSPKKRED